MICEDRDGRVERRCGIRTDGEIRVSRVLESIETVAFIFLKLGFFLENEEEGC